MVFTLLRTFICNRFVASSSIHASAMQTLETTVNRAATLPRPRSPATRRADLRVEAAQEDDLGHRLSCVGNAQNRAFCRENRLPRLYSALVCTRKVRTKAMYASRARFPCKSLALIRRVAAVCLATATATASQGAVPQVRCEGCDAPKENPNF